MDIRQKTAICVFCGSSYGDNPLYREVARAMGAGIAKAGWSLVFGGGGNGLMGDVARAAQDGGASVQGIIPAFLQALEPPVSPEEPPVPPITSLLAQPKPTKRRHPNKRTGVDTRIDVPLFQFVIGCRKQ